MAKNKKNNEENMFTELATITGGGIASDIQSSKYYVDTGNLALNYICSGKFITGGIPGGKITEIFGPSASSKSLVGNCILRGVQKLGGVAALLDAENAFNPEFAALASHIDVNKLLLFSPEKGNLVTLEDGFKIIHVIIREVRKMKGNDVPIAIVWDSISASPCAREFRETDLERRSYSKEEFKKVVGGKEQPGERAKIYSTELRKLNPLLSKMNATVIILNQVRSTIGSFFSGETTPGGKALEFYSSCRIRTAAQKKIQNTKLKKCIGVNVKMTNKKNRSFRPFVETEGVQLYFDSGLNPLSGLLSLLIQDERVEKSGKGTYLVKEKYGIGDKFKGAEDRNDIPLDLITTCPQIIDAEDREQVEKYFADFSNSINILDNPDVVEKQVKDENDVDEELNNPEDAETD